MATMSGKRILIIAICKKDVKIANGNSPPKEDHWLRMGVFLQHDPEQGTASRQHQLVGTNNVTITYLQ